MKRNLLNIVGLSIALGALLLTAYLEIHDIDNGIHYPTAMHSQSAYKDLHITAGSLPIYYGMKEEVDYVIQVLNDWQ